TQVNALVAHGHVALVRMALIPVAGHEDRQAERGLVRRQVAAHTAEGDGGQTAGNRAVQPRAVLAHHAEARTRAPALVQQRLVAVERHRVKCTPSREARRLRRRVAPAAQRDPAWPAPGYSPKTWSTSSVMRDAVE